MGVVSLVQKGIVGAVLMLACAQVAEANVSLFINFDNNGSITGNTANQFPQPGDGNPGPIYLGIGADNGPGGSGPFSGNTVAYSTETPNGMDVSGDLLIYCDPAHNDLMDIIRFYAIGQQYILVYSDKGGKAAADNGFTTTLLNNVANDGLAHLSVTAQDIGGFAGLVYLPTSGQPAFGGNITYTFTSDSDGVWTGGGGSSTVPDGGETIGLLGMALAGMAMIKRKLVK